MYPIILVSNDDGLLSQGIDSSPLHLPGSPPAWRKSDSHGTRRPTLR